MPSCSERHVEVLLYGLAPTTGDESTWSVERRWVGASSSGSFTVDETGVGYLKMDNVPPADSLWL